jgi:hypothetical protein
MMRIPIRNVTISLNPPDDISTRDDCALTTCDFVAGEHGEFVQVWVELVGRSFAASSTSPIQQSCA